jgi:predicted dehydrogenase
MTDIALLGAGFMADTHARCYEALGARVRVVCGLEADRVAAQAERLGAEATADLDTALAMPASYPFTARLRVLCEHGVLEHRFVAGAGDEVAGDVESVLGIHPADGPAREFAAPGDPWQAQLAHFLGCVANGAQPADGSFAQARAALAIALEARRSAQR